MTITQTDLDTEYVQVFVGALVHGAPHDPSADLVQFAFMADDNAEGNEEFGPLDDFGTPNAGAVHLEYRCKVQDPEGDEGDLIAVWATI